jgi:hypothetical protein
MDFGKAMNASASLTNGTILLLAPPESFGAFYLGRALDRLGVPVTRMRSVAAALAQRDPADWSAIHACVIVDLGPSSMMDFALARPRLLCLFIGADMPEVLPDSWRVLRSPFASYQAIDLLGEMMRQRPAARPALRLVADRREPAHAMAERKR